MSRQKQQQQQIRYRYRPVAKGVDLQDVKCPVCGHGINWTKPLDTYTLGGTGNRVVLLLAECWDGDTHSTKRKEHLFCIRVKGLPTVSIEKVNKRSHA